MYKRFALALSLATLSVACSSGIQKTSDEVDYSRPVPLSDNVNGEAVIRARVLFIDADTAGCATGTPCRATLHILGIKTVTSIQPNDTVTVNFPMGVHGAPLQKQRPDMGTFPVLTQGKKYSLRMLPAGAKEWRVISYTEID